MQLIQTPLKDCYIIKNNLIPDDRGYFFESFNHKKFTDLTGWQGQFVQDNQSKSSYGVVRGLHFQTGEHAQAKLVRCIQGKVLDVVVDCRPESPSFGQKFGVVLSDDNEYQFFVPRGFAHGFAVLSQTATFFYKCDNFYNKASEGGLDVLDTDLNIDWQIPADKIILSEKDKNNPSWKALLETL